MASSSTARFLKHRTCPHTETLLTYNASARGDSPDLAEHVGGCDFCGAEVQMLSRHAPPAGALPSAAIAMPPHLRRLAEDLLAEPSYNRARFAESLKEIERLTPETVSSEQ
jgi:hypothetical protein